MQSKVQNLDGMTPEDLRKVKDPLLQPYAQLKLVSITESLFDEALNIK